MSTRLLPGEVTVASGAPGVADVFGVPPQWADGDDATYSRTESGTFGGIWEVRADLSLYGGAPASVTEIGWFLRADMTGAADTHARVNLWGLSPSSHFLLRIGGPFVGIPIPTGVGPADYQGSIAQADLDYYGVTLADLAQEATTGLRVMIGASPTDVLRVYEFALIFPSATTAPPLRQFPRNDGLAGSARRSWPPPRSIQRSQRRAGGYL